MARVFVSYSHLDQGLRGQLDIHMAALKRQEAIEVWTDHCIRPGEAFDSNISAALEAADLILLLVSPDFLHSDYCVSIEMQRALERARAGQAQVVAIILRPCDWQSLEIGRMKALPTDGVPVVKFPTLDDGFHDVVKHLRAMLTKPTPAQPFPRHEARVTGSMPQRGEGGKDMTSLHAQVPLVRRSSNLNIPQQFTDLDRSEFVREGYEFILVYFTNSLRELEARNSHIQTRIQPQTASSFVATIFSEGKKVAGCGVRQGGFVGSNGINYVANDDPHQSNSSNESLSQVDDKYNLGWRSMFGTAFSGREYSSPMTHEGAASHLWDMFVSPLLQR
jgi:hypothetical protein